MCEMLGWWLISIVNKPTKTRSLKCVDGAENWVMCKMCDSVFNEQKERERILTNIRIKEENHWPNCAMSCFCLFEQGIENRQKVITIECVGRISFCWNTMLAFFCNTINRQLYIRIFMIQQAFVITWRWDMNSFGKCFTMTLSFDSHQFVIDGSVFLWHSPLRITM